MIKYISKRIIQVIPVVIGVTLISFSLLYVFPGDPAEIIVQINSGVEPSPEQVAHFREEAGLNKPIYIQYFNWLSKVVHGDFGTSWSTGEPVIDVIKERLPISAELFFPTYILSILFAFILGIAAALHKNKIIDNVCRGISLFGISIPNFWLGLVLIWIFAVYFKILPAFGYGNGDIKHAILPIITWTVSFMAIKIRFVRAALLEVLNEDYVITARAKGLSETAIMLKHVLRNALIPIITYIALSIHHLIIGSVMVETVFAWPGLGSLLVESVLKRDFPVVQALVLFGALLVILTNLLVDILYAVIDPRVKYEK